MILFTLLSSILITLLVISLNLYLTRQRYSHISSPPIPSGFHWWAGHIPLIQELGRKNGNDLCRIFEMLKAELGSCNIMLFVANRPLLFTADVPIVAKILTDHKNWLKLRGSKMDWLGGVRLFGKRALPIEPGTPVWYHKRKIMDPAFKRTALVDLMEPMNETAQKLGQYLSSIGRPVEMSQIMGWATMEIFCKCCLNFSCDFIAKGQSELNGASLEVSRVVDIAQRSGSLFELPWRFGGEKQRIAAAVKILRGTIKGHLEKRLEGKERGETPSGDILDHLIQANVRKGKLDLQDALDDCSALLIAGTETPAATLSFFVWHMLKNPEIERRVKAEVEEVYGGRETLDYADLHRLTYLEQCVKECLRLNLPTQLSTRVSRSTGCTVEGLFIPENTPIVIPTVSIQRDPKCWGQNAEVFDPDRFAPGKKIRPFTYLPFHAGPRVCIGRHFAMMEMLVILSYLYRHFTFRDPRPEEGELRTVSAITRRPTDGVFVNIL